MESKRKEWYSTPFGWLNQSEPLFITRSMCAEAVFLNRWFQSGIYTSEQSLCLGQNCDEEFVVVSVMVIPLKTWYSNLFNWLNCDIKPKLNSLVICWSDARLNCGTKHVSRGSSGTVSQDEYLGRESVVFSIMFIAPTKAANPLPVMAT